MSLFEIDRLDLLLTAAVLTAAVLPLLVRHRVAAAAFFIVTVPLLAAGLSVVGTVPAPGRDSLLPRASQSAGFVSSRSCRSCHPGEYASWHRTFHRTMTQPATPQAVVPDWNDVTLSSRGRTYRLFRRGDEFWVDMVDPAAELEAAVGGVDLTAQSSVPRVQRRVAMTTGSHHHQTYWVQNDNGMLVQFPWVYHMTTGRWVFRIDSFLRPPTTDEPSFNVWNVSCIKCHATAGEPRQDPAARTMFSRGELGIACEACHGPGEEHVRANRDPLHRMRRHFAGDADPTIVDPERCPAATVNALCGQCHSVTEPRDRARWFVSGGRFRAGDTDLTTTRHVARFSTDPEQFQLFGDPGDTALDLFWPDGTIRTGGREYHGVIASPCYRNGTGAKRLSCLSCHSMHAYEERDDQLKRGMRGNAACTQCHEEERFRSKLSTHTHHPAGSSGSSCYNCHMPHTSYALFKGIRSHTIESPDVSNTVRSGKPNACNLCHLDRSLGWTADHLTQWYGAAPVKLSRDERDVSASVLWLLRGNAVQRAVTAWNYGLPAAQQTSGTEWGAPFLAQLLDDPYSAVRYVAWQSLVTLPGYEDFSYDFDGPAEQRRAARERALQRWRRRRSPRAATRGLQRVLIDSGGGLNEAKIRKLLKSRDNTPVKLLE